MKYFIRHKGSNNVTDKPPNEKFQRKNKIPRTKFWRIPMFQGGGGDASKWNKLQRDKSQALISQKPAQRVCHKEWEGAEELKRFKPRGG